MGALLRACAFACSLALLLSGASAAERIARFASEAAVNTDASVRFHETIAVVSEGSSIRHGIFRDIPTRYRDRNGFRVNMGLEVQDVRRDGHAEPYAIEPISNGIRIKIGSAGTFVDPGPHVYEITYRASRVIGFFDAFDELYWNVTGNAWPLPIEHAEADFHLPQGATILQHAEYTGVQGAQGHEAEVLSATGNHYRAVTTARLDPGEGFTVAVAWPKGIIAAPMQADRWRWFLADNAAVAVLILGLIVVGAYYAYAWSKVGRDPPKGTIVPLFGPPAGMGPPAVRYVWREDFDDKTFAAALVGLAVKGRAHISDLDNDYVIEKRTNGKGQPLTRAESDLYNALPAKLILKQSNHATVSAVRSVLRRSLSKEFDGVAFLRNRGWFWVGAALSILTLLGMMSFLPDEDAGSGLMVVVWGGIWWTLVLVFLARGVRSLSARGLVNKLGAIFGLVFLVPFVIGGIAGPALLLPQFGSPSLYTLLAGAILLAGLGALFFWLLKAPTIAGRKILDQLEGFRMYLKTAEEDRLQVLNPPEKTPELFERFLPYALALDCENEWNAKFTAVLAAAAAAGAAAPAWYSGSSWDAGRTTSFTHSLGSSLAASTAAASTAPGSSSGSGGGGSSGGGGGGGGGGGW